MLLIDVNYRNLILIIFSFLLLSACSQQREFSIGPMEWRKGELFYAADLPLNETIREALDNGVGVPFIRQLQARHLAEFFGWKDEEYTYFMVRYHPLTRQYVIKNTLTDESLSFPKLNDILVFLAEPNPVKIKQDCNRGCELRARIKIDIFALPAPLRIPALVEPEWQLDSGWKNLIVNSQGESGQ